MEFIKKYLKWLSTFLVLTGILLTNLNMYPINIIGSAAGVVAMGMEKITFGWYLKKILWIALVGYFAGIAVFMLMRNLI